MQCYELNRRAEKDQKLSEVTTNICIFAITNPELSICYCFSAKYFGFFDKEEWVFWHFFCIFIFSNTISFEEIKTSSKFDDKKILICENKIR